MISMDYSLQQEYNDSNESDSDNNHPFYQFLIYTRLARKGETSIHSIIFIYILVIDLDLTYLNNSGGMTVWRLGISIHFDNWKHTKKNHFSWKIEAASIGLDGW